MKRYGWVSQKALDKGCPWFKKRDEKGDMVIVTAVTFGKGGQGYDWPDAKFVGEVFDYDV